MGVGGAPVLDQGTLLPLPSDRSKAKGGCLEILLKSVEK